MTYREIALLIDENSSLTARQRVAYVVAHERMLLLIIFYTHFLRSFTNFYYLNSFIVVADN